MRSRFLATVATILISGQALAYDATKAPRYASPDMFRPNVDRLIINGPGSTGPADAFSVTPSGGTETRNLSGWLGDLSGALAYVPTISGKITLAQWLDTPALPQWFGAKCDGTTDDTAALQAWLNALGPNLRGAMRPGKCRFTLALQFPKVQNLSIVGSGGHVSTFWYDGPNTTADIITIGDTTTTTLQLSQWNLSGFRVASNTKMSGGSALRMHGLVRSILRDLVADGQDGNGNLYHGLWFDQVDQVVLSQFEARGSADALRLNGTVGVGAKANLFLHQGKIASSGVGLHIGGGFGGLYVDQSDIIANGTNFLIDHSIAAEGNREIMISGNVSFDSAKDASSASIIVDDSLAANSMLIFTGTWNTTGPGHGVWVKSWTGSDLIYTGGTIGAFTDNVRVEDPTARVTIGGGTAVRAARSWGVNPTVPGHSVAVGGARFIGNAGNINPANPSGTYLDGTYMRTLDSMSATFRLDPAAYWQLLNGMNPLMSYDANDYTMYDRSSDNLDTIIGGTRITRLGAAGLSISKSIYVDGAAFMNAGMQVTGISYLNGGIQVNGASGITATKAAGSCTFTITSGLITAVSGC
jgi:hypothetical protein